MPVGAEGAHEDAVERSFAARSSQMKWRHARCALHEALARDASAHELLEQTRMPAALKSLEAFGRLLQCAHPFCERSLCSAGGVHWRTFTPTRSDPRVQLGHLLLKLQAIKCCRTSTSINPEALSMSGL